MSKRKNKKSKLSSSSLKWDELVSIMKIYGFKLHNSSSRGSGEKFINEHGKILNCHKPHPSNVVPLYIRKRFKAELDLIDEE